MNNIFLKSLKVTILSIVLAVLAVISSRIVFPALNITLSENSYISSYFNHVNKSLPANNEPNPCIVLYDSPKLGISDAPDIIERIVACNPRILAIDVIWDDTTGIDKNKLIKLDSVVHEAYRYMRSYGGDLCLNSFINQSKRLSKSYFIDRELLDAVSFGNISEINQFFPSTRSICRKVSVTDPDTTLTVSFFPYKIATSYSGKNLNDFQNLGFNYRNKRTFVFCSKLKDINEAKIRDKIVIVGDSFDYKDQHRLPCLFNDSEYIDGLNWNAYMVNTLVSAHKNDASDTDRPYKKSNSLWDLIIGLILLYIYCFVSQLLSLKNEVGKNLARLHYICKSLLMIIYAQLTLAVCYLPTHWFYYVPDVFFYLLAVVFVSFSERIIDPVIHKKS